MKMEPFRRNFESESNRPRREPVSAQLAAPSFSIFGSCAASGGGLKLLQIPHKTRSSSTLLTGASNSGEMRTESNSSALLLMRLRAT